MLQLADPRFHESEVPADGTDPSAHRSGGSDKRGVTSSHGRPTGNGNPRVLASERRRAQGERRTAGVRHREHRAREAMSTNGNWHGRPPQFGVAQAVSSRGEAPLPGAEPLAGADSPKPGAA